MILIEIEYSTSCFEREKKMDAIGLQREYFFIMPLGEKLN
jgi:hypothetical protein